MAIEIPIPSPGESITEVEISSWLKADGDYVYNGEEICEIESDKATLTLSAEADGQLKILAQEGETVEVGSVACTIDTDVAAPSGGGAAEVVESAPVAEEEKAEASPAAVEATVESSGNSQEAGLPSIAAKKIIEENNLNAGDIQGTGKDGRITKGDVIEKIEGGGTAPAPKQEEAAIPAVAPVIAVSGSRELRREPMSKLRKKISERLVGVKNQTAMLTTFNEVDMKAVMDMRSKYKESFKEKYGVGLGFMSLFTKACCIALKEIPAVNAIIDGEDIIYHDYVDVGIAVSTPKGLMVPIVRNAESMSLAQIELTIKGLALKARDGKISIDEMTGGNFTITNGGVFGSMLSTPILNPPQSAILGMHNIVERPIAINGEVVVHPVMYLALSYDHRVVDGKESVTFLYRIKEVLEDPNRMMLEI
ncbi:2-oxoglutarate dehydrogenase complex dihydrolipoyllysine-residue succinyltransferase [Sphingobacteriaceae bacterium AH-315-L07]|nr:2-oxoglutarate dehydrogenase complex dihydrolipoyllysine-residue succinyltransferase [Sphingobacteriaceae bacterium AH-315-L07]